MNKLLILGAVIGLAACQPASEVPTAPGDAYGYIAIYKDPETGCQYLQWSGGNMTPRLNDMGVPMCGAAT